MKTFETDNNHHYFSLLGNIFEIFFFENESNVDFRNVDFDGGRRRVQGDSDERSFNPRTQEDLAQALLPGIQIIHH